MTLDVPINDNNASEVNNFPNVTRSEELRFSVYALVDPTTSSYNHPELGTLPHHPFYIGKGNKTRKYGHVLESRSNSSLPKDNKLRILLQTFSIDDIFVPLVENLSHVDAISRETELIKALGRRHLGGLLCNITSGGEGRAEPHTDEWKDQHSIRMSGSKNPSAKHSGWLCHAERGNYYFKAGEFNELCKRLELSIQARKLLVGYVHSFGGFVLSDRPLTDIEVQAKLDAIKIQRTEKFQLAMAKKRKAKCQ